MGQFIAPNNNILKCVCIYQLSLFISNFKRELFKININKYKIEKIKKAREK
jgi:hypothetical protein